MTGVIQVDVCERRSEDEPDVAVGVMDRKTERVGHELAVSAPDQGAATPSLRRSV